ncbi:MAG: hypothetical protein AABX13_03810 [Nanoarchaeota archaeon]
MAPTGRRHTIVNKVKSEPIVPFPLNNAACAVSLVLQALPYSLNICFRYRGGAPTKPSYETAILGSPLGTGGGVVQEITHKMNCAAQKQVLYTSPAGKVIMELSPTIAQKILLFSIYALVALMIIFFLLALRNKNEEGYQNCIQKKCERKGQDFCSKPREIQNCCLGASGQIQIINNQYTCQFS